MLNAEQRDDAQHPGRHHDPGAAPQAGDARVAAARGQGAFQDGGDAGEQVRHADQVAEDEIAVEADEREQLLQHLQVREGDDQEQELVRGGRVEAGQGQHEDQVEVQAAEVGAQPPGAAEPVGVGDVGEERRARPGRCRRRSGRAARRRSGSRPRARTRGTGRRPRTGRARRAGPPGRAGSAGPRRPARGRRTASNPRPARCRPRPRRRATGTAAAAASRRRSRRARAAACPAPCSANSGLAFGGAAGVPSAATMPRGSSLAVMR